MSEIISEKVQYKNINEAVQWAVESCYLQIHGVDVQVPYIAGAPGGGKTQSMQALAQNMGKTAVVSTHFAITPYEEHSGIPQFTKITVNGKDQIGTVWSFPAIMKKLYELSEEVESELVDGDRVDSEGVPIKVEVKKYDMIIWLLDDMHLCGSIHMALLYELLTERKLREYDLPASVALVMAGNHGHNKAGSKTMFSAIINRIFMMPVTTTYEEWREKFAIKNNVHYSIMSFLKNENYQKYFHEDEVVDNPWGSPRAWTRLSNFLSHKESWTAEKKLSTSDIHYMAQGHVSPEATSDFVLYYDIFTKFDIKKILAESDNFKMPNSLQDQYILCFALCSHVTGLKDTKKIIPDLTNIIFQYISDVPDLGYMMFQELVDYEKTHNKRNIYENVCNAIGKLDPTIMDRFIELITGESE